MDIALSGKLFFQRETILPIHFHIPKKDVTVIGVERVEGNLQGAFKHPHNRYILRT